MSRRASLDLLLRVRELHERLARTRLADAAAAQTEAEHEADALEESLSSMVVPELLTTPQFCAVRASQRSMAALVVDRRSRAAELAAGTAAARDAWLLADRDRGSIERLLAHERDLEREAAARAEQKALDDLVAARALAPTSAHRLPDTTEGSS